MHASDGCLRPIPCAGTAWVWSRRGRWRTWCRGRGSDTVERTRSQPAPSYWQHISHISSCCYCYQYVPPLKIQSTPHCGEGSGNIQVEDCLLELCHQWWRCLHRRITLGEVDWSSRNLERTANVGSGEAVASRWRGRNGHQLRCHLWPACCASSLQLHVSATSLLTMVAAGRESGTGLHKLFPL